jgi:hypothetical protein
MTDKNRSEHDESAFGRIATKSPSVRASLSLTARPCFKPLTDELSDDEWTAIKPRLPNKAAGRATGEWPPRPQWHLLGLAIRGATPGIRVARKTEIVERFQADFICPVPLAKIFRFSVSPNQSLISPIPHPKRGALRDRHERWARDAMDAFPLEDERREKRTVKSCGPGISTPMPSWAERSARWRWQESPIAGESAQ